jgi:DtxR family Mn-dependent transcriptional regulator
MVKTEALSSSLEDYLEAIFHIVKEKGAAKARDISKRLGVTSPSVTEALKHLAERNLVNYQPYDVITLTDAGETTAKLVVRRHDVLRDFLVKVLAVTPDEADEGACRMEHAVGGEIIERLIKFVEFLEVCPRGGTEWIKKFAYYYEHGRDVEECERCLALCLDELELHITGSPQRSKSDSLSTKKSGGRRGARRK